MTFVLARIEGESVTVWSDFLVTKNSPVAGLQRWPDLKLLILDPATVVGVAGDDTASAIGNLLEMWAGCRGAGADALRSAISEDGDGRREYLLVTSKPELFKWSEGRWTQCHYGQAWIGVLPALEAYQPDPLPRRMAELDDAGRAAVAQGAAKLGFTQDEIAEAMSGQVERELQASMQFDNAVRSGGPDVGGLVAEVHLIDGRFQFAQLAERVVLFGAAVLTEEDANRCLLSSLPAASHRMGMADDRYPAALRVEFTQTGAALTFRPGADGFERVWEPPL